MKPRRALTVLLFANLLIAALFIGAITTSAQPTLLTGRLAVIYDDDPQNPDILFRLMNFDAPDVQLAIDESTLQAAGGLLALQGQPVNVEIAAGAAPAAGAELPVRAIQRIEDDSRQSVTADIIGLSKWVNLLCRFSGNSAAPSTPATIDSWFDNTYSNLDHYYRENSYNLLTMDATTLSWVTLPHNKAWYMSSGDFLRNIWADCVVAYGASPTFSAFYGMNLFLNDSIGSNYGGGNWCGVVQGANGCWGVTWLSYNGAPYDRSIIAHEMGHGFGLPHSNNSDADSAPYEDYWDLMSVMTCRVSVPNSCIPPHTIAYHKDRLGWIAPAREFTLSTPGTYTITLDRLARLNSPNYQMVVVPISATKWYTVEARRNDDDDYDESLVNDGVIIHEIDTTRLEPAWQVNAVGEYTSIGYSGLWTPGETYRNHQVGFSVTVNNATADGYSITLFKGTLPGAAPDLVLSVSGTTSPGYADLFFQVTNNGAGVAHNVLLTSEFYGGFKLLPSQPTDDCFVPTGTIPDFQWSSGDIFCNVGTLNPGQTYSVPVETMAGAIGSYTLYSFVVSDEADANAVSNRHALVLNLQAMPDLNPMFTLNPTAPTQNNTFMIEVILGNLGGMTAFNAGMNVILPPNLNILTFSSVIMSCQRSGQTFTCTNATSYPGSIGSWARLYISVWATQPGEYVVNATANPSVTDLNPANDSASYSIFVRSPSAPPNDMFPDATVISVPQTLNQSVVNATIVPSDPAACAPSGIASTVWFSYTPTGSGNIEIDTEGSSYDTVLAVFRGEFGSLTPVGCSAGTGTPVSFSAYAGTTYHIMVAKSGTTPAPSGSTLTLNTTVSPNLIMNGDFSLGLTNWGLWSTPDENAIVHNSASDGVFRFYRTPGSESAVILQNTGAAQSAGQILEAQALLSNNSGARKRAVIILHDADWSDLQVCAFWVPPTDTAQTYTMRTATTEAWTAAHLSIYISPASSTGWLSVDDVRLTPQPSGDPLQTVCIDPNAPS